MSERITQLTLAFELAEQGLSHTKIATHLGRHRETIGRWLPGMATYGRSGFLERHRQAKSGPPGPSHDQEADLGGAGPPA